MKVYLPDKSSVTTLTHQIDIRIDISKIADPDYINVLVKTLNAQMNELHIFITGRINSILAFNPFMVSELKSALKDFE